MLRKTPTDRRQKRQVWHAFVLLSSLLATTYFTYHSIHGTYGLKAHAKLQARATQLERDLAALEAVRVRLRRDTALLAQSPPDPDMVEEIAHTILGFLYPDETIIR